jgi:hypothetical protein
VSKAFLVDLEKCRYSYPSFDLAHATLYTSTTWDVSTRTVLSVDEVCRTYAAWSQQVPPVLARDAMAWHVPLRRAMWLWSITWCAKWRVTSRQAAAKSRDGEDWSAQKLSASLAGHVSERVDHYLSLDTVRWCCREFDSLERLMADGLV